MAVLAGGQLHKARELFEQVCQADHSDIESWVSLVTINARLNRPDQVERCCRSIIALLPGSDEAHYHLGCALMLQQKYRDAVAVFRQAIQLNPRYVLSWLHLGKVLHALDDVDEALYCYRKVTELEPDSAQAYSSMGRILENRGEIDAAMAQYKKALQITPGLVEANIGLAYVFIHLGEFGEAQALADRALQTDKNNEDAIAIAANVANRMGDPGKAFRLLRPVIESGSNHVNAAITFSNISRSLGKEDEAISMIEHVLASQQAISSSNRCSLHFELGRLYDYKSAYEKAFMHYQQGNMLKRADFDTEQHRLRTDALIANYSSGFMASAPRASLRTSRPVFVVGMIRSGTTLIEQILASHPAVHGAGELPDIIRMTSSLHSELESDLHYPQCLALLSRETVDTLAGSYIDRLQQLAPGADRVIDKMPGNFMHLGLIEMLFPDAVVIHCIRDPLDTCLSAYFQDFSQSHAYSYDLRDLGAVYGQYLRVMEHWRKVLTIPMLEVQYEDLIADQMTISRRLVEFCGLEWDERCLRFHEAGHAIATASYDQVRRSLYKGSAGRWKNYAHYLDPLRMALERG